MKLRTTFKGLACKNFLPSIAISCFLLLFLGTNSGLAHWPNTNATKFVQLPDLSTNGMDVFFGNYPTILADDFVCTNTGPVTDIHLWISSLTDQIGTAEQFELSIWTDVPASPANGTLSHPGVRLWSEVFGPGQYEVVAPWASGLQHQFWNFDVPVPQFLGPDSKLFQFNFYPQAPYTQTGTVAQAAIYWLGVTMNNNDPPQGWTVSKDHLAPDFAVLGHYDAGGSGTVSSWKTLFDPRFVNRGLDFSFALTTRQPTNPPPPCCPDTNDVKFVQYPNVINGLDVNASRQVVLADDFLCTNTGPITDIHIWGSWLQDTVDTNVPIMLALWSDIPAVTNATGRIPSKPGQLLWQQTFGPGEYVQCLYTNTTEQFYDPSIPAILGGDSKVYYLCFYPKDPYTQQGTTSHPTNYWLSVNAQPTPGGQATFGWHTTANFYNDNAVWGIGPGLPPPGGWNEMFNLQGQPLQMAFKVNTRTQGCPPPVLSCPTNRTVECGTSWTFDPPIVSDPCCGTNYTLTFSTVTNGTCPVVYTRTWQVVDCKGATGGCSQSITVVDTTPPVLTCATNKTVLCGSSWTFDPPTAVDGCCGTNVTIKVVNTFTNGLCPQTITRIWEATDCCTNRTQCEQIVTVIDNTPPVITCATNKTVECGSVWGFDPPTAVDNCCTNVTINLVGVITNITGACNQLIQAIWQATDCCNNSVTCTQSVRVVDTTPPVIVCVTNKTVDCSSSWTFDFPTAFDNCCANVPITVLSTITNGLCPRIATRTWVATDCCGNTNLCSQSITIVDNEPPVITCATNKTVECGSTWTFDPPTAIDRCCGTNVTVTVVDTITNGTCPQIIRRIWKAVDCCNNSSSCDQAVTVVDTTPPVITCATNKTVECGTAWTFDPPVAIDSCCGTNITVRIANAQTNTLGQCRQFITVTWEAIDCCQNRSTCTQLIIVADTTPPVLTCATNKTVECGAAWTFDPPSVFDLCCGTNVSLKVVASDTNGVCPRIARQIWLATDCCTNTVTCTQLVAIVDTTPPVLTCATNKTVECGSTWAFDPPFLFDACSGTNVTLTVLSTLTNGNCPRLIQRTWQAVDNCGNSNQCSQVVTVVDTTPPTIVCPTNIVITSCTNVPVFYTVSVSDACTTNITVTYTPPSGTKFAPGTTNVVHVVATDPCLNSSSCDFAVIILRPPVGEPKITHSGTTITITWSGGVLQESPTVFGPWTDVAFVSPYVTSATAGHKFYRVRCAP